MSTTFSVSFTLLKYGYYNDNNNNKKTTTTKSINQTNKHLDVLKKSSVTAH